MKTKIEITTWSIVKVILVILGFYVLYMVRSVLALLFVVLVLVATFSPTVDKWSKKITRPGAVLAILLILLGVIGLAISLIIPPLVSQTVQLVQNIPDYIGRVSFIQENMPQIKESIKNLSSQIGSIGSGLSSGLISFTTGVFGGMVAMVTGLVLFTYLLLDEKGMKKSLLSFFADNKKERAADIYKKVADKAGNWLRGQMLLGIIIGVIDMIGLLIIGVPYALTLAVISGLMEIVPTIGPIISGVLAALLALSVSPIKAIIVIIWYILVQQLENTLIVPKVMQKAVGLSPVIVIIAILVGAKIYGIVGVVLSVPIAASIMVLVQEWSSVKSLFSQDDF